MTTGAFFLAAALWAVSGNAWGHAFPDHSDPKVGATLTASPPKVRIWFDSPLEPVFSTIKVLDAAGSEVDKRDGGVNHSDGKLLEVSLPRLKPGSYRVIWSVVGRDGHRTTGDYAFVVR
jgi:methionine-rich copper-binding protein CopC